MTSFGQIAVFLLFFLYASALASPGRRERCVKIAPFCANLTKDYKQMRLPNFLGHDLVDDVTKGLRNWSPLVGAEAGKDRCPERLLKIFLCSIYAPVCVARNIEMKIQPCRSLCVKVRDSCDPVMKKRSNGNITWPSANNPAFNCSTYTDSSMCINAIDKEEVDPDILCSADLTIDELNKKSCASDFVLKIELVRHRKETKGGNTTTVLRAIVLKGKNHKKPVSSKGGKRRTLRMFFPANSGDECDHLLSSSKSRSHYLVTGKYEDGGKRGKKKMVLTVVLRWKKSYKRLLKRNACSQH